MDNAELIQNLESVETVMNRNKMIGVICGMLLGDASASITKPKGKNAYLSMMHCKKQESYLDYKIQILSNLCKVTKSQALNGKWGYYPRLTTKCHPLITQLREWFYGEKGKRVTNKILYHLTPLGIALWYMDDGYLAYIKKKGKVRGREIKIYSQSFTESENQMIVDYFKKRWGLIWRIGKTKLNGKILYHVATGAIDGMKFFELIAPYVPESMNYKCDMRYIYSSYAGQPNNWLKIQSELGSNVKTVTEMITA